MIDVNVVFPETGVPRVLHYGCSLSVGKVDYFFYKTQSDISRGTGPILWTCLYSIECNRNSMPNSKFKIWQ